VFSFSLVATPINPFVHVLLPKSKESGIFVSSNVFSFIGSVADVTPAIRNTSTLASLNCYIYERRASHILSWGRRCKVTNVNL
jgi:hypothetical protein